MAEYNLENEMALHANEYDPEAPIIDTCAWCGNFITQNDSYVVDVENYIHKECFMEYLLGNYMPMDIAEEMGMGVYENDIF